MKVNAVSLNHTRYYNIREEDKTYIKEIRTTYAYDPELGVHLCELTPSHDLRYLDTYIVYQGDPTEDKRGELDEMYCHEGGEDTYIHITDVRQFVKDNPMHFKECGEFDDMEDGCEYLQGNCPF